MSAVATRTSVEAPNFEGNALLIPSIQSEPLPVRAMDPAPCTQACPAGINVKAYVSLIAEALRWPLPGICGRICHAPCESSCNRSTLVAIRALKRLVANEDAPWNVIKHEDLSYGEGKQRVVERFQPIYIERALARADGNITRAAQAAGLTRAAFQRIMRTLKLERSSFVRD